ncbi:MAG: hypothetical protein ACK4MQ_07415 [Hyphomonas sp.]
MPPTLKAGLAALLGAAALLAACATPEGASTTQLASASAITASMEGQEAPDGTVIRCRSMQVTGSRFPAKECKSEQAWKEFDKAMAENAKAATDGFQRLNSGCSTQSQGTC